MAGRMNLHTCAITLNPYVVDPGFVVNLVVYSAPDQPPSPDQPRSLAGRPPHGALKQHSALRYQMNVQLPDLACTRNHRRATSIRFIHDTEKSFHFCLDIWMVTSYRQKVGNRTRRRVLPDLSVVVAG